jgi:hypothetical protein
MFNRGSKGSFKTSSIKPRLHTNPSRKIEMSLREEKKASWEELVYGRGLSHLSSCSRE